MASGYSQSPKLLKGAIIQFSAPMLIPIPNIIIFQYNPETMSRTLTPWSPVERKRTFNAAGAWSIKAEDALEVQQLNSLAQPYDPKESFTLTLELDATDALEKPGSHPVAVLSGVADRIAALEMLLYPPGESALGGLLNVSIDVSIGSGGFGFSAGAKTERPAKRKEVPIVLFFWGPGRVVPVRLTSFAVEEQAFNPLLYPLRAKVTVGLLVLDENDLVNIEGEQGNPGQQATLAIAKACYKFTRVQKEVLATANLLNSIESIAGMLPF